ncbi:glutathione S-transferase family protein [Pseudobacteriovorax antillogorgiicola]|uniref:Glutathione S-transferase n=1 Tax=Pseudobacteriovorax antillogorgiicola TaxID=1513793 RepID=A0A1Y6BFG3_9BACT|nr:glutathione S-transferase family protein [Pseudobacteriovorax antillogorgiicola]TCS56217.1 glutathione S-transferase [Pseudobacteriovorax antillogorgiicola]SMF08435.1 glutathione S-transferase [Pseudobacteriovorax antillogorgiicola]
MKLFYSSASPYARKVRVLIREFEVSVTEKKINTSDNDPDFIKSNPLGKVPAMTLEDNTIIFDSGLIGYYLDEKYNDRHWQAKTWDHKQLEASIQGILDQSVTMIIEKRRPEEIVYDYWIERYKHAIPRGLAWIWQRYESYLSEGMSLASVSLVCALEYLDFRHPEIQWRKDLPDLEAWLNHWKGRQSFLETRPE